MTKKIKPIYLGIFLMLGCSLLFALMAMFIKLASKNIPVIEITFFRAFIATLVLSPFLLRKKIQFKLRHHSGSLIWWRDAVGCFSMILNFYAITHIPLGDASLLNNTSPLFLLLFAETFLKEKVQPGYLWLVGFSFLGISLILKPHFEIFNPGGLAGLFSGMTVGWVFILIKKLSKEERAVNVVMHFMVFSTFATLPFLPFIWVTPSLQEGLYLLLGGVCGAVAQIFITKAFHYGPASIISSFGFTQVLIAMLFGITFFKDQLALNTIIGGAIVIICGVIISKFQDKLVKQI